MWMEGNLLEISKPLERWMENVACFAYIKFAAMIQVGQCDLIFCNASDVFAVWSRVDATDSSKKNHSWSNANNQPSLPRS